MAYIPKSSLDGDFPDNSNFQASREDLIRKPKIEPGDVKTPKQNWLRTVKDDLFYTSEGNLGDTIMETIIEPAIKNAVSSTIDTLFNGIKDAIISIICGPDYTTNSINKGGYYAYGNRYNSFNNANTVPFSSKPTSSFNSPVSGGSAVNTNVYRNIVCKNRGKAEGLKDDIIYMAQCYGTYRLSNLLSLLDWPSTGNDVKWGWTSDMLTRASIKTRPASRGEWVISLPDPIYMEV